MSEKCVRSAEILIVGDVMAHMPQVESARIGEERFDFTPHFRYLRPLFEEADLVVANLETTLSPRPPYSGYPRFSTPEELARDLADVGVGLVSLANNHIADCGRSGVLSTIAALDNYGVASVGAAVPSLCVGSVLPKVVRVGDFDIAFVACTDVLNVAQQEDMQLALLDTVAMRSSIAEARSCADFVVVLVHWGEEYHRTPSRRQRAVAEWFRSAGVDFIVGGHPHVIQPWHKATNAQGECCGAVFYSLGNFISNQNDKFTDFGLAARIGLRQFGDGPVEISVEADTLRRIRYEDETGRYVYRVMPEASL